MWSDLLQLVPTLLPNPGYQVFWILSNVQHSNMKRLEILKVTLLPESIYEGLRRPRWSQFASEIYKVYFNVGIGIGYNRIYFWNKIYNNHYLQCI